MGVAAAPVTGGFGVNEGSKVWSMGTIVGDKDGITTAAGGGVASAANAVVSFAFELRDLPCCEPSVAVGVASTFGEAVAVATCKCLTSMCVGVAVESGFATEAIILLDGEAPDVGVTVRPPLSSMAAGVLHAHSAAMKSASIVAHRRGTKPAH